MKPTVLVFESGTPGDTGAERKVLGLTLRDRLEKSCIRDGAVEVHPLHRIDHVIPGPVVLVPSTLVGDNTALKALLDEDREPGLVRAGASVVARFDSKAAIPAEALASPAEWLEAHASEAIEGPGFLRDIARPRDVRDAENALLQALRKPVDGLISRTINRPVSLETTRWLARTPVTPNQWTIVCAVIGVVGAVVMAQGGWLLMTFGAFLVHLSSVWDGCDGELARVKFKSSKVGEWLDTIADDIVNSGMTLGLGFGVAATTGNDVYATIGLVAFGLYAAYTAVIYHQLVTRLRSGFALDFEWWFEEGNDQKNIISERMGAMDVLKLMVRRDFFVFLYFALTAVALPAVALWLAFTGAVVVFTLGALQTVMTTPWAIARRTRKAARLSASVFTNLD